MNVYFIAKLGSVKIMIRQVDSVICKKFNTYFEFE
jgi:hypothetical protein